MTTPMLSPEVAKRPIRIDVPWEQPTRLAAAWHTLKTWGHIAVRTAENVARGPRRIRRGHSMTAAPIIAEHRSALWLDGRADEFLLRCGKVQNLRVAIRRMDGIEVAAGQTLSFWSQVGRPSAARGFVVGREIVKGCVVPTIGGGLCQLSNALASLVFDAGARLVEHHRHSALIEEREASLVDATVAWNYVDLRIAADFSFRIELELTHNELLLRLRAPGVKGTTSPRNLLPPIRDGRTIARGCLTCDRTTCFRHKPHPPMTGARVAVLLNDRYPELGRWLERLGPDADWMLPWVRPGLRSRAWTAPCGSHVQTALWPSWKRICRQRFLRGEGAARQAGRVRTAADLARDYARRLRPEHTELVVTQDLLVPLWRLGVLDGRSYDVYVPELPASELQARLDSATSLNPQAASLHDYRVDACWQQDEWKALARARTRLTAHHDVYRTLRAAGMDAELLPWAEPPVAPTRASSTAGPLTLTLASSALPRKGSIEVATVARALGAHVLILGSPPGDAHTRNGVDWSAVGYSSDWLSRSDVVVLPAHVEHQPRALLQALAVGVPVVASRACGLGPRNGLTEVEPGDPESLRVAILEASRPGSITSGLPPIAATRSPRATRR